MEENQAVINQDRRIKKDIYNVVRKYFGKITRYNEKIKIQIQKKRQLIKKIKNLKKANELVEYKECIINVFYLSSSLKAYTVIDWEEKLVATDQTNQFYGDIIKDLNKLQDTKRQLGNIIENIQVLGYSKIAERARRKMEKIPEIGLPELPLNYFLSLEDAKDEVDDILNSPKLIRFGSKDEYLAFQELRIREKEKEEQKIRDQIAYRNKLAHYYKSRLAGDLTLTTSPSFDDLLNLSPVDFEEWVKKNIFEKEGWEVESTKKTRDGGIDLVLYRQDGNKKALAQCKRYKGIVSEPYIRDFYGAMIGKGTDIGYFVTTGYFSHPALDFSKDKPIIMIDKNKLINYLV